jgi:hypothetical protein
MRTFVTPSFERCLGNAPEARRCEIIGIIRQVAECYGHPHKHLGLGIRKIGPDMECRDSLGNRLVFFEENGALCFAFYGNHDEVKRRARHRKK